MKKYEAYKNSGVEWIGEIPEGWESLCFKHFVTQITTPSTHPNKIALENIESKTGNFVSTDSEFEGNGIAFEVDDIVYGKLRPYLQKVWKAEFEGNAVGDFFVFRVKDNCIASYLKYIMLSDNFTSAANGSTYGAKMPRVASEFIANSVWFLPSLSEQQAIASYLDHKVGQIDASVSAINTQIDDLKAYRQSIISEAVTKGLNPNVPMKDSGIEWIGEIPEGWEVVPFKYVNEGTNTGESIDKQYWTSNPQDKVFFTAGLKPIFTNYQDFPADKYTKDNDLLVARNGTPYVYYPSVNSVYTDHIIRVPIKKQYSRRFVYYVLPVAISNEVVDSVSLPTWSASIWNSQLLPVPPLSEQQAIASYLDSQTSKIDATIASLEAQRDDLNALKQSVISEAVTGKIDVREWYKDRTE